jgi:hypothetical protein
MPGGPVTAEDFAAAMAALNARLDALVRAIEAAAAPSKPLPKRPGSGSL